MDILLKTPKNWLEILRDLDFSAFNNYMPTDLKLYTRLQNKKINNRVKLNYEIVSAENDSYIVSLSLGRFVPSEETSEFLSGSFRFDYNKVRPPLTIPECVGVEGNGIEVIDKLINDFFPGLIEQGYDFSRPINIDFSGDGIVRIREKSTKINQIDELEWITEAELNQLKEKYGKIEKVVV